MSDQGMSKAAKKNKKRKDKKKADSGQPKAAREHTPGPVEILEMLKEQLQISKESQDHAKAKLLRQQIWVLNDVVAGVRTEIPDEELRPILASIPFFAQKSAAETVSEAPPPSTTTPDPEKKIRALRKKLEQIQRLKEMQKNGEKMQENQLLKIASEQEIQEEIDIIQDALANVSIKR